MSHDPVVRVDERVYAFRLMLCGRDIPADNNRAGKPPNVRVPGTSTRKPAAFVTTAARVRRRRTRPKWSDKTRDRSLELTRSYGGRGSRTFCPLPYHPCRPRQPVRRLGGRSNRPPRWRRPVVAAGSHGRRTFHDARSSADVPVAVGTSWSDGSYFRVRMDRPVRSCHSRDRHARVPRSANRDVDHRSRTRYLHFRLGTDLPTRPGGNRHRRDDT